MLKNKILILILVIIAASFSWFAFSGKDNEKPNFITREEITSKDVVVIENESGFEPQEITIKKGTRIIWLNKTQAYIWPASNLHPTHEIYPDFDPQEPYEPNMAWAFEFKKAGEWGYHDHLKSNKRGRIIVID